MERTLRPADELLETRDRCDFVLSEVRSGRVTLDMATLSRVLTVRNEARAELFDHGTRLANRLARQLSATPSP